MVAAAVVAPESTGHVVPNPRPPSRSAWSPFPLGIDLGLGAALAIFLAASFTAYGLTQQAVVAAVEARRSLETLTAIQELLTFVVDAETGQRGYLLTGDDLFLDPYKAALPQIATRLASLRAAQVSNPQGVAPLERLSAAVGVKLAELEATLRQSRSAGLGAPGERLAINPGRVAMDNVRALAHDLSARERETLRSRSERAKDRMAAARRVVVGGLLIDFLVLLAISLVTHREIRTRARAEEELEAANAHVQEVLDASTQISIIATDLRGVITLFNRGAEAALGYAAAEVVGRERLLIFHLPSELETRAKELGDGSSGFDVLTAPVRRGVPQELDWTYVRKGGAHLTVTLSVTAKHDPHGARSGYLAIARDVTEERRVDRRQAAQHAATQALGESVTFEDAIPRALSALGREVGAQVLLFWTVDRGSRTLRLASSWCGADRFDPFVRASRNLTFARDVDLPGRVWHAAAPVVEDLAREASFSRAGLARSLGLKMGFGCPVALGGDVLAVTEAFSQQGEPPDPLLLDVLTGIGTQIAQFMERDAADRARRAGDERTKAIIENMLEGLIVVDHNSLIVSTNRAAERMFGYESWELAGQHLAMLVPGPPAATKAETAAFLKEARRRSVGRITEWKGKRKNGESFPFELSLYEFHTPEGRLFAGHVRDISERLRLDQMKKDFVANVSHELRTPLTSIRGSLTLLSSGVLGDLPDEAKDVVGIAERNTLRLITLINDILDLERLESGHLEIQIAPTSLRTVSQRSLDSVKTFADEQGVLITSSVPEIVVLGDGDRLVQVLVNLLSNAVKFSERGSSVEVTADARDGRVEVGVADHGRGIPADAQGWLFQRFHQVESSDSRKKGGTGLGLAICRVIIEQHGGEIGVRSELGKGSTFWFRVPAPPPTGLAVFEPAPTPSAAPPQPPVAEPHRLEAAPPPDSLLETLRLEGLDPGQPDVLLVDDDQALLGVLARQLLASGLAVRVASTSEEAIAKARALPPGLIVLDLGLPDGSGFAVVAALREDDRLQSTPLLVYTGRDLSGEDRRRLRLGRTRFLTKSRATDEEFHRTALNLLGKGDPAGDLG